MRLLTLSIGNGLNLPNQLLSMSVAMALAVIVFAASSSLGDHNPTARLILCVALVPIVQRAALAILAPGDASFSIFFLLPTAFIYIVPGVLHSALGHFPFYNKIYPDADVTTAAIIVLAFSASYWFGGLIYARIKLPQPELRRRTVSPNNAMVTAVLLSGIAMLGFVAFGPSNFLAARRDITELMSTPEYIIKLNSVRFMAFAGLIAAGAAITKTRSRPLMAGAVFVFSAAAFLATNSPLSIPRFALFAYAISALIIFVDMSKPLIKIAIGVFYPLLLTTVFPAISLLSRGERNSSFGGELMDYYASTGDFDAFQSTINVVRWIQESGHQFGAQIGSALLFFLPRSFWPDKRLPTGSVAAAANGYDFTNISAPLPAEFFSDFGWLGVIACGVAVGLLAPFADTLASRARKAGVLGTLATIALISGFSAIILRGSLLAVIGPVAFGVVLMQCLRLTEGRYEPAPQFNRRPKAQLRRALR